MMEKQTEEEQKWTQGYELGASINPLLMMPVQFSETLTQESIGSDVLPFCHIFKVYLHADINGISALKGTLEFVQEQEEVESTEMIGNWFNGEYNIGEKMDLCRK